VDRHGADEALAVEADTRHQRGAALHRPRRGEHVEHLTVEHGLVLRALRVDDRRRTGHRHRLFDGADRQRAVDLRGERALEHDAFALDRMETGQRERHGVGARAQIDDGVPAGAVGDGAAHLFDERGARRFHRDARHDGAARVLDDADDAGALLSKGRVGTHEPRGGETDDEGESTHVSCSPAWDKEAVTALIVGRRLPDVNNFRNSLRNLDIRADCGQYERLREVCFQCEKR
jgi:hypothetical protein